MDQFLAEYYGTSEAGQEYYQEDDLEKMAQLTLLTKEAAAEGVDLGQFSDEELVAMADELYGNGAVADEGADLEKEAAAKFEEADYLGRVMAHSFNHELGEIEKEAGAWQSVKDAPGKAWGAVKGFESRVSKNLGKKLITAKGKKGIIERNVAEGMTTPTMRKVRLMSPDKKRVIAEREVMGVGGRAGERLGRKAAGEEMAATARRRGRYALGGAAALGTAGVGGGAYAATRDKKSSDSAFDQLVEQRAYEHLEAAGLLEKQAEEDFDTTVDRAALELLETSGYPVEWY